MDFKTTTRPRRNLDLLAQARALLSPPEPGRSLRIAEVGPGLAVRYVGRLAAGDMPARGAFKLAETMLRRLPLPDAMYENYETREIVEAFGGWKVDLTLFDINDRALRIVRSGMSTPVTAIVADLGVADAPPLAALRGTFDVAIALAVLGRIEAGPPRRNAGRNLISLVRSGGLVLENTGALDEARPLIEPTGAPSIYRRG